jgi:hypothetical protein
VGIFSRNINESVDNAGRKASIARRQAQAKNTSEAARSAGRGKRAIGGTGTSRHKPSQSW